MVIRFVAAGAVVGAAVIASARAYAQAPEPQTHQHAPPPQPSDAGWRLMQDGVVYGLFNHQGGPRGGDEFVVPNWWMGMWTRGIGRQQLGLNLMLSADAATVGEQGYREIFQIGEAFEGKPLVDYQHPHDFLMQLSASWRWSIGSTDVIVTAGPAGEPTIGPVAFMHRPSAAGLPLAPLGHHTFDSTHVSFGVLTAGVTRGAWTAEGSVFNGREPDEHRWDLDLGAVDSFAGRLWFAATPSWTLQVSSARLRDPEELTPGDVIRTTASAGWFRSSDTGFAAFTIGYGMNRAHGEPQHGVFGEATVERNTVGLSARLERQHVETSVLLSGEIPDDHHGEPPVPVTALTLGASRRLFTARGFEGAIAAQATMYQVPEMLRTTHGRRPLSAQVFFRLRLPSGPMGRMWNMVMSRGHRASPSHSGH